ncbi:MAG: hypothetical protein OIN66_18825 [Candidatus Methanoperedens sp.]|nr:hypothetical protein [Candidatus Methanoperedens sp.]
MGQAEISSEFEYSASFLRILIPGIIAVTLASILAALNYSNYISVLKESIDKSVWVVLSTGVVFIVVSMLVGLIINVFNTRLTMVLEGYPLELEGYPLELNPKKYLFCWNEAPGKDNQRLIRSLKDNFGINWVEKAEISKTIDNKTIRIVSGEKYVEITLDENRKKALLKIIDKQIYNLQIKEENGKLNIYQDKYLFGWDEIPGNDCKRLLTLLKDNFGINWVGKAEISKTIDNKTIRVFKDYKSIEIKLNEDKKNANLRIIDNQIYKLQIKEKDCRLNVYQKKIGILRKNQWEKFERFRTTYKSAEQDSIEKGNAYTNLYNYYSHCLYSKTEENKLE